ncbi:MAG: hypothetical protein L6R19_18570 [Alphaproteobacteria bacterium]|nr:hypothetical protein [Alphaproteobacteria bacterium]
MPATGVHGLRATARGSTGGAVRCRRWARGGGGFSTRQTSDWSTLIAARNRRPLPSAACWSRSAPVASLAFMRSILPALSSSTAPLSGRMQTVCSTRSRNGGCSSASDWSSHTYSAISACDGRSIPSTTARLQVSTAPAAASSSVLASTRISGGTPGSPR